MKFSELNVGQKFKFNSIEYQKAEAQKVSCCKVLNAINVATQQKVMIKPIEDVELVTE